MLKGLPLRGRHFLELFQLEVLDDVSLEHRGARDDEVHRRCGKDRHNDDHPQVRTGDALQHLRGDSDEQQCHSRAAERDDDAVKANVPFRLLNSRVVRDLVSPVDTVPSLQAIVPLHFNVHTAKSCTRLAVFAC